MQVAQKTQVFYQKRKFELYLVSAPPTKRSRNIKQDGTSMNEQSKTLALPFIDHDYATESMHSCLRISPVEFRGKYNSFNNQLLN